MATTTEFLPVLSFADQKKAARLLLEILTEDGLIMVPMSAEQSKLVIDYCEGHVIPAVRKNESSTAIPASQRWSPPETETAVYKLARYAEILKQQQEEAAAARERDEAQAKAAKDAQQRQEASQLEVMRLAGFRR